MSDSAIRLVEVSLTAAEASARAGVVRSWLLSRGVVVPNPVRELMAPSEFLAGPRSEAVFEAGHWIGGGHTGVDVVVERRVHHAFGNYEPPSCPACGSVVSDSAHHDLVEPWLESSIEPAISCVVCGLSVVAGDLVGRWGFQIGELAVVFHNWPPLLPGFAAELGAVMGPRTRVVLSRT